MSRHLRTKQLALAGALVGGAANAIRVRRKGASSTETAKAALKGACIAAVGGAALGFGVDRYQTRALSYKELVARGTGPFQLSKDEVDRHVQNPEVHPYLSSHFGRRTLELPADRSVNLGRRMMPKNWPRNTGFHTSQTSETVRLTGAGAESFTIEDLPPSPSLLRGNVVGETVTAISDDWKINLRTVAPVSGEGTAG